jgi:transcription termination factor Rho
MTMSKTVAELKIEYEEYLKQLNIDSLRSLGRHVGVYNPTENKRKSDLIALIISVLVGETMPVDRTRRGAPVKAILNPDILRKLSEISGEDSSMQDDSISKNKVLKANEKSFDESLNKYWDSVQQNSLVVKSSKGALGLSSSPVLVGQVEKISNFYCLFPVNGRDFNERIFISDYLMKNNSLKVGDVISCTTKKEKDSLLVEEVLLVNEGEILLERNVFDELEICDSKDIVLLNEEKLLQYFLPISKGDKVCFVGAPKSGKTTLLKKIVQDLTRGNSVKTFALLIEQAVESAISFSKIVGERNLIYTTYEDEAEAHLFFADFMLKRVKRYAEQGKDVVLVIDGLQALAKAYDELNYSNDKILSCGLASKTIRFIKKLLASARSFEKGGSLTILCSLSNQTGNPEEDLFISEIASVFNGKILLNEKITMNRQSPTIDLTKSFTDGQSLIDHEEYLFILNNFLPKRGVDALYSLLSETENLHELYERAKIQLDDN